MIKLLQYKYIDIVVDPNPNGLPILLLQILKSKYSSTSLNHTDTLYLNKDNVKELIQKLQEKLDAF